MGARGRDAGAVVVLAAVIGSLVFWFALGMVAAAGVFFSGYWLGRAVGR